MLIKNIASIYGGNKNEYPGYDEFNKIYNENNIYKLIDLYFKQKNRMFNHLIYSFDRLIEYDIITFLKNENNHYFYEAYDNNMIYRYKFIYDNIVIKPPHNEKTKELISPYEARLKNLTYKLLYECSISQIQEIEDINTNTITSKILGTEHNFPIGYVPVMTGTKYDTPNIKKEFQKTECKFDPKGYFIVSGQEKALMSLERLIDNKPLVFIKKESNTTIHTVQVNSKSFTTDIRQIINIILKKESILTIKVPILQEIPVVILLRALGIESDKDIIDSIVYDNNDKDMLSLMRIVIENSKNEFGNKIYSQEDALLYLSNKIRTTRKYKYNDNDPEIRNLEKRTYLMSLFNNALLPHMEFRSLLEKARYFGLMINKLLQCYLERIGPDDRDSFQNKRVDLPGNLLYEVFKQNYKKMLGELTKIYKKRDKDKQFHINPPVIIGQLKISIIDQGFKTALSKGTIDNKEGVSQMLPRMSYLQTIAALRRINSPTAKASTNKLTGPRHLHPSQIAFLCYIETPEGHNIGLIKNFSLMGSATIMVPDEFNNINKILATRIISLSDVPYNKTGKYTKVFLNGIWLGFTKDPVGLVKELREFKMKGTIDKYTSIVYEIKSEIEQDVRINCDSGRLTRPILCVNDKNELYFNESHLEKINLDAIDKPDHINSFNDFMYKYPNVVEFIDVDEQTNSLISMWPKNLYKENLKANSLPIDTNINGIIINRYDENLFIRYNYCEFHPSMHLGCVVSNIPLCNHNQGPRNIYQYSHAKQAMGIYATNWINHRMDSSYILYHTSRPIVSTRNIKYINTDQLPAGENAVVALLCYSGFNQEDSVMMNQSAIDRGFMNSCNTKKYNSEIRKNQETSKDDIFKKPDPALVAGLKHGNYEKLNERGFVPEETTVYTHDVLISKLVSVQSSDSEKKYRDSSELYKQIPPAVVHRVIPNIYSADDYEMIKGVLRSERIPHIGDKFCLTPDHDVLTNNGWIPISKVTLNHCVATLNDNNTLSYENPLDLIQLYHNGPIYNIDSICGAVCLSVTLNHKMYIKKYGNKNYELTEASNIIGKNVQYKNTCEFLMNNLMEYLGYDIKNWSLIFLTVLIHGKMYKDKILINIKFAHIADSIVKFFREMDIEYEYIEDIIVINNKEIIEYFKNYGLSSIHSETDTIDNGVNGETNDDMDNETKDNDINYYLPDWCFELSKSEAKYFINLLIASRLIPNNNHNVVFTSKRLIDDIQRLCIHAGFVCSVVQDGIYWKATINENYDPFVNIINDREYINIYNGHVYCLEVPNHIFMVRKNGKYVWTGNCSRHGQKGTLGKTYRQSDMPFTSEGITPDIIVNPHAIPSRMTMGQILECLVGKIAALQFHEVDGTPFQKWDKEKLKDTLEALGYNRDGKEYLYNGMTGKRLEADIFIGPTYYQRLKHMVSDKIHSRSTGAVTVLTHQPPEGRARDGGLRFGEMERDCMIVHGLAQFLKERMFDTADPYNVQVCDFCGYFAQRVKTKLSKAYTTNKDVFMCPNCKNKTDISTVCIPYACKILFQELLAMNIAVKIKVPDNKYLG
ncbi:DNA-directed RNA polymerase subunit beta [Hokovirus HKV1]|uniref:DNA-directed RNA polymerase n=1 Tax=Hokovirus HKV1 TaxID=1977638 RepID=A0A1V0SGZ5_9VIRU|nr:DNA-directed RNA polymerase subunit beta [Hokovirus HKV1]